MEVSGDLVLAQRLPHNTGWSWTLASRLGNLLERAEQEFGARDRTYTPVGVEFSADGPRTWYPGNCRNVLIQINSACANDPPEACYQLAQECIHLLAPTGGNHANYLEEGLSIVFATRYVQQNFGFHVGQPNPKYAEVARLVETLFAFDPEGVRKVRAVQPSFSQITVTNLRDQIPDCPVTLAEQLLRAF
jgi:hypothetical protein